MFFRWFVIIKYWALVKLNYWTGEKKQIFFVSFREFQSGIFLGKRLIVICNSY